MNLCTGRPRVTKRFKPTDGGAGVISLSWLVLLVLVLFLFLGWSCWSWSRPWVWLGRLVQPVQINETFFLYRDCLNSSLLSMVFYHLLWKQTHRRTTGPGSGLTYVKPKIFLFVIQVCVCKTLDDRKFVFSPPQLHTHTILYLQYVFQIEIS